MNAYLAALEKNVKTDNTKFTLTRVKVDPYWKTAIKAYNTDYGFNMSYMKYILDENPHYNNGKIATDMDPKKHGGCWTKLKIIYLNPKMYNAILHYEPLYIITPDVYHRYVFRIILHELAHEIYNNLANKKFKDEIKLKAEQSNFNTEYLKTVKKSHYREEQFAEYLSYTLTPIHIKEIDNPW